MYIERAQGMGVVSNSWFDRVFTLDSLPAQTLMRTDVQAPVLGTPLGYPLNRRSTSMRLNRYWNAQFDKYESV